MGDAGYILFGPPGRELLAFGTIVFAVFATGGQLLAGQIALANLSSNKLCLVSYPFPASTLSIVALDEFGDVSRQYRS